jgi:sugar lactone lactonase YvrE
MAAKPGQVIARFWRLALAFLVANVAWTQQYSISTLAGRASERQGYAGDGGPATNARLSQPSGVAADGAGSVFVADYANCRIRRVLPNGVISTVAGNGNSLGNIGDGGPATNAQLWTPQAVALDSTGNIFVADASNHRIRKVSTNGLISTVAGVGSLGYSGDGGPATQAQLVGPSGIAVDVAGNLFISDSSNNRVRKVSSNGTITTLAGKGAFGFSGDGGPATSADLAFPEGVAVDGAGNVFVADEGNNRIRKISPNGQITTIAGTGAEGFSGDGGPATSAALNRAVWRYRGQSRKCFYRRLPQ